MDTIFLILERFNQYSDILRGELIKALAEKWRVVVITPDIDEEAVVKYKYFKNENVVYQKMNVRYPRLWHVTERYIRRYFVRAFDNFTTRYLYYQYPHTFLDRLLRDAGSLLPKRLLMPSFFTRLEMAIARPSREYRALVETHRPVLIAASTAGFGYMQLVIELVIFSKQLKLPLVAINASFDNTYTMPKFVRKTDYFCVAHDRMKREVEEFFFYAPQTIFVSGVLKFDHYFNDLAQRKVRSRREFLQSKNLDPEKKLIVYATPTPGTYKPRKEFMRELIRMKREHAFRGDPNILVRLHPFDEWNTYEEFIGIPGIHIERSGPYRGVDGKTAGPTVEMGQQDLVNQTETFMHADVLVNYASTTLVEACIFDTPVVSIAWPEKAGYAFQGEVSKAIFRHGAGRIAANPAELERHINAYLEHPERDQENRKRLVDEYVFFTDGNSYQRIVDFMKVIIEKEKLKHSLV